MLTDDLKQNQVIVVGLRVVIQLEEQADAPRLESGMLTVEGASACTRRNKFSVAGIEFEEIELILGRSAEKR